MPTTIRITTVEPVGPRSRYKVIVDYPDGRTASTPMNYNSFRLLLILSTRTQKNGGDAWVPVSELARSNTGRYLYRMRHELALGESWILNDRQGNYRLNPDVVTVQITPQGWKQIAEFPDAAISGIVKTGEDVEVDARRAYAQNYYQVNKEKYLEYQKKHRAARPSMTRANVPVKQRRVKRRAEVHLRHLRQATGGRLEDMLNDIISGRRTYLGTR